MMFALARRTKPQSSHIMQVWLNVAYTTFLTAQQRLTVHLHSPSLFNLQVSLSPPYAAGKLAMVNCPNIIRFNAVPINMDGTLSLQILKAY